MFPAYALGVHVAVERDARAMQAWLAQANAPGACATLERVRDARCPDGPWTTCDDSAFDGGRFSAERAKRLVACLERQPAPLPPGWENLVDY